MNTSSLKFIEFAIVVALLYNVRREVAWRQAILLVANLAFLATLGGSWVGYAPLAFFVSTGYVAVHLLQQPRWRGLFLPVVVIFTFAFFWLKRYTFLPHKTFLPFTYLTLGLSYIFFRIMHMIVDARDETLPPGKVRVIPYLNYTLNFTSLVSGPIQLYPEFAASQLGANQPTLTMAKIALGFERVVVGFFKLRVLSAIFAALQRGAIVKLSPSQVFADKALTAWVVVGAYPLYLYFNFSGFIDVMIGLASLCHLELPENFNRPFSASNFIEFWTRWHMTLSNWLKAYVFTPLLKVLMNKFPEPRVEPFLGVIGFFVTFFLIGLWHGQTSEFLFFGFLVGGGVAANKLFQIFFATVLTRKGYKTLSQNQFYVALSRGLTFAYFALVLIWFWSRWPQIARLAAALTITQEIVVWLALWLGATIILAAWEGLRMNAMRLRWNETPLLLSSPVRAAWAAYLVLLTVIALSNLNVAMPVLYQIF